MKPTLSFMTAASDAFKDIVPPMLHPPLPSLNYLCRFAPAGILISFFRECAAAADASLFPLPRFALAAMCAPSNIDSFAASSRTYRLAVS